MARPQLKAVPLASIDWNDEGFAIPGYGPDEPLVQSLKAVGILHPPLLWEKKPNRFVIVDGFKRLSWLRPRSSHVDALVFPEETEAARLLVMRLEIKMLSRSLNLAEKVQILARYAALTSKEDLRQRICPALGISWQTESLSLWQSMATWPARHLSALARDLIAEKTALSLAPLPEKDRESFLELVSALRCSASLQMEILERCQDIARRDGIRLHALVESPEMQAILEDKKGNRREKTAAVRELVHRWRFPRLHERMKRLERAMAEVNMPSALSLVPPPHWEGDMWELRMRFRTPSDLAVSLTEATHLCAKPSFQDVFEEFESASVGQPSGPSPVSPRGAA
jgi:ParB family chromosome partitioning protein